MSSYEAIPYISKPFHLSHPDRLAMVGTLLGMAAPRLEDCRVLELGCARGGNLIPMACAMPEAEFLGIDLSPRQIAEGRSQVQALGLENIALRALDIREIDLSREAAIGHGQFDFIIAHGLFSWTPPGVQDKIFDICGQLLARNGIAYISCNVYPGWHARMAARDLMCWSAREIAEPQIRVRAAREALNSIARTLRSPSTVYGQAIRAEADRIGPKPDAFIAHEHLEEVNLPIYFHEFMARAHARGLQYLGDSQLQFPFGGGLAIASPYPGSPLDPANVIRQEQLADFQTGREFRRTLLCRSGVALRRVPSLESMKPLRLLSVFRPVSPSSEFNIGPGVVERFQDRPNGPIMTTAEPALKATLSILADRAPASVPLGELLAETHRRLGDSVEIDYEKLATEFVRCHCDGILELIAFEPPILAEPAEKPAVSPIARLQAQQGGEVVNLRHRLVTLNDLERLALTLLDGTRDRDEWLEAMDRVVQEKRLQVQEDGQRLPDRASVRQALARALDAALARFAANALLIG